MCKPNNKGINLKGFPVQLTKWLPMVELANIIQQQGGKRCYGNDFVVKDNKLIINGRRKKLYAVFIKERRRTKRAEAEGKTFKVNLADLVCKFLSGKKAGISILTNLLRYKN